MSDFEARVAEVLRSESAAAPDAIGLADAARSRARTRRRTRAAAVGVIAIAVLALPVGVVALTGDDDGVGPAADRATPTTEATPTSPKPFPDGRWETWHGVTVRVPGDWAYGSQSTWCAGGGSAETFVVDRPGGPVEAIACSPASSYGVTFQDIEMADDAPFDWPVVTQTGEAWPAGTLVGAHGENGVLVTVAGPDRDLVADVLSTVSVYGPVDPHGCSATDDGGPGMAGAGEVPVCRYDADGRLVQSEKLTGAEAEAATAAVTSAPDGGVANRCLNAATDEFVVMGIEGDRVEVRYGGNVLCGDRGLFVEGVRHDLTAGLLYWALSPGWSGSVGPDAPLPPKLRGR